MSYFDDFILLNVTKVRMYGNSKTEMIRTGCFYLGIMQGSVIIDSAVEKRPFIYLTPRNIVTANGWHSPVGQWRENFYIECSGERPERMFSALGASDRVRHYFVEDVSPFFAKLLEMQRLFSAGNMLNRSRITLCFEEFTAELESAVQQLRMRSRSVYNIDEVLKNISRNPAQKLNMTALAEQAGVTLRHWTRLFKQISGMSPGQFAARCRLQQARELLSATSLPIKEIADRCGFDTPADFSRFFRRYNGNSPGTFRKQRML